jgi:hypothetical protein
MIIKSNFDKGLQTAGVKDLDLTMISASIAD